MRATTTASGGARRSRERRPSSGTSPSAIAPSGAPPPACCSRFTGCAFRPAMMNEADEAMSALLALMARLRDPQRGCPWDREQTFGTIAPYTIEEAYEIADAIARGDLDDLRDELGDLLLQVVFHARMAQEQ